MTIASRCWLAVLMCGLFVCPAAAQQSGQDIVQLDKSGLSSMQLQSLRDRLGDQLLDDEGHVLIAPRDEFADAFEAFQWPGLGLRDGVPLNPLRDWENRQLMLKRVFGPVDATHRVDARIDSLRGQCLLLAAQDNLRYQGCARELQALQQVAADLKASDPGCQPAAQAYLEYQRKCKFSCPPNGPAIKRDFDAACLASPLAWKRLDGTYRRDPLPAVFNSGGAQSGVAGMVDAVVLIELDDADNTHHVCGGLLLSGNRVLTGAHCFVDASLQSALTEGRVFARRIRNEGEERYRLLPSDGIVNAIPPAARDYLVLPLQASQPIITPQVIFREPDVAGPAVVLGYFADYDTGRAVQAQDAGGNPLRIPTWKLGLRWAKPGMCHVIETVQGCVRTLCQTIPGYSGAPIFSVDAAPASPLIVYGVISGADSKKAQCGTVDLLTTVAASAKDVLP